jgi:hypothetical protein
MKIKKILQAAALGGALLSATANAQLEIPNDQYWDEGGADKWRFIVAFPMLWAPSIDLEIQAGGATTEAEISFGDSLKNLQMGFMGELYFTKAWFGVFLKGMYMDVETDELETSTQIAGDLVGLNLGVTPSLQMGLYDMGFSWRVWRNLRIITLARATSVTAKIKVKGNVNVSVPNLPPPFGEGGTNDSTQAFEDDLDVDPGLSWDYQLGAEYGWWMGGTKRHGINIYGDAQVDGDSDSSWLAEIRYMYRVSKLNNFWLGWRHYEMKTQEDDEGDQTVVTIAGPLLGWAFSF